MNEISEVQLGDTFRAWSIMRLPDVIDYMAFSRSSLYSYVKQGLWTKPVKIGPRSIGWPVYEVVALNNSRISGKSNDEIRSMVTRLEAARKE